MGRRTVISVSISERNPDAVIVQRALDEQGIDLAHGGGQILKWAAQALTRPMLPATSSGDGDMFEDTFGMSMGDINALLDDF